MTEENAHSLDVESRLSVVIPDELEIVIGVYLQLLVKCVVTIIEVISGKKDYLIDRV
jgi:hypothetical protein